MDDVSLRHLNTGAHSESPKWKFFPLCNNYIVGSSWRKTKSCIFQDGCVRITGIHQTQNHAVGMWLAGSMFMLTNYGPQKEIRFFFFFKWEWDWFDLRQTISCSSRIDGMHALHHKVRHSSAVTNEHYIQKKILIKYFVFVFGERQTSCNCAQINWLFYALYLL